jgi:hypothetical protein
MPNNQVSDPITDHEVAFAHLILSGTMNDRQAAKAVGSSTAQLRMDKTCSKKLRNCAG